MSNRHTKGFDKYLEFQYHQAGGFYTRLFQAIQVADEDNLERLEEGFPSAVDAYKTWSRLGAQTFLYYVSPDHRLREKFIKEYALEDVTADDIKE